MRGRNACRTLEADLAAVVILDLELGGVVELLSSELEAARRGDLHVFAVDTADGDFAFDFRVWGWRPLLISLLTRGEMLVNKFNEDEGDRRVQR